MNRYTSIGLLGTLLCQPLLSHAEPLTQAAPEKATANAPDAETHSPKLPQKATESDTPQPSSTTTTTLPVAHDSPDGGTNSPLVTSELGPESTPSEGTTTDKTAKDTDADDSDAGTLDGDNYDGKRTLGRFRVLLQLRYRQTFADSSQINSQSTLEKEQRATVQAQDGYDIQRAFLRYTAKPSEYIEGKLLVDFAELRHGNARQSFKLAYLQIHPTKRLQFDIGLLKRTYSLLELLPIADHELADLGPTDSFIKDQGYGGRDVGAIIRYQPLPTRRWMTASIGAFSGDIDEGYDAKAHKLITARIESLPVKQMRLGINGAYRPEKTVEMQKLTDEVTGGKYYREVTTLNSGKAFGADASLLLKRLQVRAEVLYGDRTEPNRAGDDKFLSAWLVVAPNFKVGGVKFVPAAKIERLDLTPSRAGGCRTVFTGVFGVVPLKGLRLITDVTRTIVDRGLPALSRVPWTSSKNAVYAVEPSTTTGTVQIQYQF